jgi:DegV family protein with EDD domain
MANTRTREAAGMIGETAVVTDSASYLPGEVLERFGISVIPMNVVVDGRDRREFVDLDAPEFYRALAAGARVGTSQPSPGAFLEEYERACSRGAKRIVSMHIGSALSGTVNSARIAAGMAAVPVHVIDTGQASFIEGLCVWEGCEVLAEGGSIASVATAVRLASEQAGNVFIVRGLMLLQKGGRLAQPEHTDSGPVPVLALVDDAVRPVGSAATVEDAMGQMVGWLRRAMEQQPRQRFRVGVANGDADGLAAELEARVRRLPGVAEVVPYIIGPAVGAHTGPGCTGLSFLGRPV